MAQVTKDMTFGELLVKYYDKCPQIVDDLMEAGMEQLLEVEEVGEAIAGSILDFFSREQERSVVERLRAAGLRMEYESKQLSSALQGTSWVISGTFSRSRQEMKALVESHGGKLLSGISSKTDFVLAGEKMGPEKRKKAQSLGIPLLTEAEFMEKIGQGFLQPDKPANPARGETGRLFDDPF